MKTKYLISCAAFALMSGCGVSAFAADTSAPVATAGGAGGTQDIVVTAERRDQTVQKVPMTIEAFTGATLSQLDVSTLDQVLRFTPNITYGNNGPGQGEITMRGLSSGFRGNQSSAAVGNFPNVAIYLDDQSMQFPGRNVDIYMADMNRVEVLEGPQGTLFGGGAEAGALRYITNKPKLDTFEAKAEASYSFTSGGAPNNSENFTINVPVIQDKLALRGVFYNERQGGYIDNVLSNFDRSNIDLGNTYWNITPGAGGLCANGLPPGYFPVNAPKGKPTMICAPPNVGAINNNSTAGANFNPVTYIGARASALYQINDDWNVLISESLQDLDAEGLSVEYPVGSNFQTLAPLQVTSFNPAYDKDKFYNTAWTVNGKFGPLKAVYNGGYTTRHVSQQMEYTNYSRTKNGQYYQCVGGGTGWSGDPFCYSPSAYWDDNVRNTHLTQEFRLSTPDDWRLRAIGGAYYERFRIYDVMNFNYKTLPACSPENLQNALAGGPICVGDVETAPGSTANDPGVRGDNVAFGEDVTRGYDQTALYASIDFDIIPNVLTITGGTRWYHYSEFEVGSVYGTNTGCQNVAVCTSDNTNIDNAHDHVTYSGFRSRASITWHVTPDTLTYFTFSQGFRPGGFNRGTKQVYTGSDGNPQFQEPFSYQPDSLNNYEVGLKTALFDHRLQLNLSAYLMDWSNVQFLLFDPTFGINTTFGINGPGYQDKGVEAQWTARLTDHLTVQGSATYNLDEESEAPCLVANIAASANFGNCITEAVSKVSGLVPLPNPFGTLGSIAAFAPKFQGDIRARYDWMVNNYNAWIMVGGNYTTASYNQPANYPSGEGVTIPTTTYLRYEQPAYGTVDTAIGVSKDQWTAQLFATNLFNSHASTFTSSAQFIKSEVPLRPRVFGIKVGASF